MIDPEGTLATGGEPERLFFDFYSGEAPDLVRAQVGGTPGTTVYLVCGICPWAFPGCQRHAEVVLDGEMQTLDVSTEYAFALGCDIATNGATGTVIIDDLELHFDTQQQSPAVPSLSMTGAATLVGLLAVLGVVILRRVVATG